jgi:hypothetical protein
MDTIYQAIDSDGRTIFEAASLIALENLFANDHYDGNQEYEPDISFLVRFDEDQEFVLSRHIKNNLLSRLRRRCDFADLPIDGMTQAKEEML